MAGINPNAVDSIHCCGDPTDLPPVVEMSEHVLNNSEDANEPPQTFEEVYEHELKRSFSKMPEGMRSQIKTLFAKVDVLEAGLGEADLAELERMKVGIREQFKRQEALFMPAGAELDITEEARDAREQGREKMIHFRAVSTLIFQKQRTAIAKRIQESRQYLKEVDEIIYTPEERAKQDAIQAVTDLAFPE